jgi:hypothetical protein
VGIGIERKVAVLNRVVKVGFIEKLTFEKRLGMEVRM